MRVLFQYRRTYPKVLGGDTVRAEHTRAALERLGVKTKVATDRVKTYRGFDLAHIWQATFDESFAYAEDARRAGVPYVVSTIFLDQDRFGFMTAPGGVKRLTRSVLGRELGFQVFRHWSGWRVRSDPHWKKTKVLLDEAAALLATSEWELDQIRRRFRTSTPSFVTTNAVDFKTFSKGSAEAFRKRIERDRFLLCVGRINIQKNQLLLIRAAAGMDLPVVLVGDADSQEYLRQCREEAKRRGVELIYLSRLSAVELADAFAGATAHVLPSWIESTGQVSLQAAAAGCPVVQTEVSPWRDYFGDLAEICKPERVRDIRGAIERAVTAPVSRRQALQTRMKRFTWERSAQETLKAYRTVL